jgi:hypothetical protein
VEVSGPRIYQALVVRKGLEACLNGLRLNASYTPTNLLRTASNITGKKYGRGTAQMQRAREDLAIWIERAQQSA